MAVKSKYDHEDNAARIVRYIRYSSGSSRYSAAFCHGIARTFRYSPRWII
ncbi:MAG: hypothetical protein KDC04_02225 [Saprospiraceae bacterium]|nr:hypothetical protein [Saprospiraceae bacterium]